MEEELVPAYQLGIIIWQSCQNTDLMKDAAIIGRNVSSVQKETLLYCHDQNVSEIAQIYSVEYVRLLKLLTGVETSTRPVKRSGRVGNVVESSIRRAIAAPKAQSFLLSTGILHITDCAISSCRVKLVGILVGKPFK